MNSKNAKRILISVIQYTLAMVLVGVLFRAFISAEDVKLLTSVSLKDIFLITFLSFVVTSIAGIQYGILVKKQNGVRMKVFDILTLPVSMSLWGLILPFQGTLLYMTVFLKSKYKSKIHSIISLVMFGYLISFTLTGIVGILYYIFVRGESNIFTNLIFPAMTASPFLIFTADFILSKISFSRVKLLERGRVFVSLVVGNIIVLMRDVRTSIVILSLNLLHTLMTSVWYYVIAVSLEIEVALPAVVLLALFNRLSIILKFTPGNIGVQELISGGLFVALGLNPEDGVLIVIVSRLSAVILMVTVGVIATVINLKFFKPGDIFKSARNGDKK